MTQYLHGLIARLSGGSEVRPLVPFIRTAFSADAGEVVDPFESIAQAPPQTSAPQALGSDPGAAGWVSEQRGESLAQEFAATEPSGATMPAAPDLATAPLRRSHEPASRPKIRQSLPPLMEAVPDAESVQRARRAPDERPEPDASTPASIMQPANPPLAEESNVEVPARLGAKAISHVLPQSSEVVSQPETETSRHLGRESPLLVPSAMSPSEEKTGAAERSGRDLRPPTPSPVPLMPRALEQPRVVIGRLRVEVVPARPTTPQPMSARFAQRPAKTPSRSEPSRSKLRFGLGQL